MRILHIHTAMRCGGIEAMICGLANEMAKTNDVTVCSIFQPSKDDVFWNKLDSSVVRATLGKTKKGLSFKSVFRVRRFIKQGHFDVVNIHGFFSYYLISVFTLRGKTRFFYTVHSDATMENASWSKYLLPFKKRAFSKGFVHPITISQASNDSFRSLYGFDGKMIVNGIPKPNVTIKHNYIDDVRISNNTKVFLHPGRISIEKNQVVLCKVFNRLIHEGYDVVLLIAGINQNQAIFEEMESYFNERIQYIGVRDDIPELLIKCEGMCLPSIWEGLPVTLLEALSVGCVPICAPVGGIVNVVGHKHNGILSKSSNYEDYLNAMREYLNLPESMVEQLKSDAKASFHDYDIVVTSQKYMNYYRECSGIN